MAFFLDLLVSVLSLAIIGQYTWSMRAHFHSVSMPAGAMLISAVVIATSLFFLGILWLERQPIGAKLAGFALEIASLMLFWWAITASRAAKLRFAFDADNPDSLVTEGPYWYVRHPFYTSYAIFWVGWGVATCSIWAVVPVAGLIAIYMVAALGEERKFSTTTLAGSYDAYRRRTGFFWPRLRGEHTSPRSLESRPDDCRVAAKHGASG